MNVTRVNKFKIGDKFLIEAANISNRRVNQNDWVEVEMRDDQAGEYIVLAPDGERVSLDGYERAQKLNPPL
jgi:hypothetical protein|tara:strand:- start:309 stop:521 length:213 start_codon:yes stop_codon:yes gene_type:complete